MTPEEYLHTLRKKLKRFSPSNQANLVEEIVSHIESGEDDPGLGKDLEQRRKKLMSELGSPALMAKGMRNVYQPDGVIDYLLVAIPLLLNTSLNVWLVSLMPRYIWADVRVVVLLHLILVAVGVMRHSKLLTIFWASRTIIQVLSMLVLTQEYYLSQMGIWLIVLVGLAYLLAKFIWQNRRDMLVVVYAVLPVIVGGFGIIAWNNHQALSLVNIFDIKILDAFSHSSVFPDILNLAALAAIFFSSRRGLQWGGLLIYSLLLGSWVTQTNNTLLIWIIIPILVVLTGWFNEKSINMKKAYSE